MLKQLIQRLLDSRTTPEQAAHSCLPNSTSVNITPDPSGTRTYVPPQDGYVTVTLKSGENSLISFWGSLNTSNTSYAGSNKVQPKVFMPVEKGRTIGYTYSGEFLSFVFTTMKGIGGGYKLFFQEVQLCLRTSYSSCLKLLSRVKRLGLANSPTYRIRQLTTQSPASPHSQTEKVHLTKHIRHQMTAGLLADIGLYRHYLCQTFQNLKLVVEKLGEKIPTKTCEFSSLVVKGIVYGCGLELLRQKAQPDFLGSFPRLELFNLAKGGLPC